MTDTTREQGANRYFLKEWRVFRGLKQDQAAERIGISRNYLSELERGVKRFHEDTLAAMSLAYECEVWELLGRDPSASDAKKRWASIFDRIPQDRQSIALNVAEDLAGPSNQPKKSA